MSSAVEKNPKIITPPKAYPAGRRWGKSFARLRWEREHGEPKPELTPLERSLRWDRRMQRAFKGIITRKERHRSMDEAVARDGVPPRFLAPKSDPNNPKGQPKQRLRRAR